MTRKKQNCLRSQPIDCDLFTDLRKIRIDEQLPVKEKTEQYLDQIETPYRFQCGTLFIRVAFNPQGKPFESQVKQYLDSVDYS